MLHKLSTVIASFLEKKTLISAEQYEMCVYGIDLLIYTIISTIGLMGIGVMLGKPVHAFIIIMVYYINQTVGGGKHAKTHFQCFVLMGAFLCLGIAICYIRLSMAAYVILAFMASGYLSFVPLVLHENKKHLVNRSIEFIKRSRMCVLLCCILEVLILIIYNEILDAFSLGLVLSALSRYAAQKEMSSCCN